MCCAENSQLDERKMLRQFFKTVFTPEQLKNLKAIQDRGVEISKNKITRKGER